MVALRVLMLAAAVLGISWFSFVNDASAQDLARSFVDRFDDRPARKILFVGNSRMYSNDMPHMVRKMADSVGASHKYQVTMWARPGRTLEWHWTEGKALALLTGGTWDDFVFQAGSVEQANDDRRSAFFEHGSSFAAEARRRGVRPAMIVGWVYGHSEFTGNPEEAQQIYYEYMQEDHAWLRQRTGTPMINVGRVFKKLTDEGVRFPLMTDGNHPSVQGSYVSALMTYAHLAGTDGSEVTFVPAGMTHAEAATIRDAVSETL